MKKFRTMKGGVAAGHPLTARAGCDILAEGGNAIDAAVAAAFMTFVAEPSLTTIAGSGFMMVHNHSEHATKLYDFFSTMPGTGKKVRSKDLDFYPVELDFGGTKQEFFIGNGAAAVPGNVHGLLTAHKHHGRLPLAAVLAPAIHAARKGVKITKRQAFVMSVVRGTVMATAGSRALYAPSGELIGEGEVFRNPDLADTIEEVARGGIASFYRGDIAAAISKYVCDNGGLITRENMAKFRTRVRNPLVVPFRGHEIVTNPLPSWGGRLIAFGLELLDSLKLPRHIPARDPELMRALVAIMWLTNDARANYKDFSPRVVERYQAKLRDYLQHGGQVSNDPNAGGGMGSTTHISVLDAAGNAASVTTSHGEGNGVCIPGTGIVMNNLLGEEDINPAGFHQLTAGEHLPSMMAPTLIMRRGRPQIVLGSAGSNRLRTAILQTIAHLLLSECSIHQSVNGPRAHWERGQLDIEPGFSSAALRTMQQCEANHKVWAEKNMFFGGLHAVMRNQSSFCGAGDKRRGGVYREVS